MGEPAVSPTYCPINGAYTFTYSVNDGTENSLECSGKSSEISDCPYGFVFNLKFRGCSFGNMGKLSCKRKVYKKEDLLTLLAQFLLDKLQSKVKFQPCPCLVWLSYNLLYAKKTNNQTGIFFRRNNKLLGFLENCNQTQSHVFHNLVVQDNETLTDRCLKKMANTFNDKKVLKLNSKKLLFYFIFLQKKNRYAWQIFFFRRIQWRFFFRRHFTSANFTLNS